MTKKILTASVTFILAVMSFTVTATANSYDPEAALNKAQIMLAAGYDTVGWLLIPEAGLDVPVVQSSDNLYYVRRDIEGAYSYEGSVFADFRCESSEDFRMTSPNIVIYANSFTDDPDDPDARLFDLLKKYRNPEFARTNQYICFTDIRSSMIWQVFAVSIVGADFPYNDPNPADGIMPIVNEVRALSLHPFEDVEVGEGDRLLTLSTVDYSSGEAMPTERFVVMAKLINGGGESNDEPEEAVSGNYNPDTGR